MPPPSTNNKKINGLKTEEKRLLNKLKYLESQMVDVYKGIEGNRDSLRSACKHKYSTEACEHTPSMPEGSTCEVCQLCGKVGKLNINLKYLLNCN